MAPLASNSCPVRLRRTDYRYLAALGFIGALLLFGGDRRDWQHPAAANAATTLPATRTIRVGALDRTYNVFRPAGLSKSRAVPLVVMLHGGFGTGKQAEQSYGWDAEAQRYGFVVAYPDGIGRSWNAGGCCGSAKRNNIDDVGFINQLLRQVIIDERIDPNRMYATGISNGAMMAYRLACDLPNTFAAIGPVAGTMVTGCAAAAKTSVMHIHGLDDKNVPFNGGIGSKGFKWVMKVNYPSVPSVIARWRMIDQCGPETSTTKGPMVTSTAMGADGTAVTLITIAQAGHQWPGGQPPAPGAKRLVDKPSTALNATDTLWQFFQRHTLAKTSQVKP